MFTYSHNIRQLDTMGVSVRYWLRWTVEPELHYPLLPAVLHAGDYYGLALMEFPLYNLLTAPFYFFGFEEGRILARLFALFLIVGLTYWHHRIWQDKVIAGIPVKWASLLLFIYSVTPVYLDRFMPDYFAFILASIAVGLSWDKPRVALSIFFGALGLLVKPPVVTVFVLLFLKPKKEVVIHSLKWVLPAIGICLLYYVVGLKMIGEITDFKGHFAVALRSPWLALSGFFSTPVNALKVLSKYIFSAHTFILVIGWIIYELKKKKNSSPLKLLGLILFQYFFSIFLVGSAGYDHNYYFIGSAFIACVLMKDLLETAPRKLAYLCTFLIVIYTAEKAYYTLRVFPEKHIFKECAELRQYLPKSEWKVNSIQNVYAHIGPCMGVVQSSKTSNYSVYLFDESPDLEGLKLVHKTEHLRLYRGIP